MNIVCNNDCKDLVRTGLDKGIGYEEYVEMIDNFANENASSGEDQSDSRVVFTKLNQRRMKRWNKTVKVSENIRDAVQKLDRDISWLVLTESWCGDAAHVLPVLNKVASLSDKINFKVLFRDENPELMNNFLTDGAQSIPKVIMVDNTTGEVVETYGSRPKLLTEMAKEYKQLHGKISAEFKEEMQKWYNKDKGQTIMSELSELL